MVIFDLKSFKDRFYQPILTFFFQIKVYSIPKKSVVINFLNRFSTICYIS